MTARFRPGERVAYITQHDAYLGVITELMFYIDTYLYACDWADGYEDGPRMYPESNFRRVH